jgi:hypothetical protein
MEEIVRLEAERVTSHCGAAIRAQLDALGKERRPDA